MSNNNDLLSQLAGQASYPPGENPWQAVAATSPPAEVVEPNDAKLEQLLRRVASATGGKAVSVPNRPPSRGPQPSVPRATSPADASLSGEAFVPAEPANLAEAGLSESEVEALILKYLVNRGSASGRQIADHVKLPFLLIDGLMHQLKHDRLAAHRAAAEMGDYVYQATEMGRERGKRYASHCTYFGAAPVPLKDYIASVKAQSIEHQRPTVEQLNAAFADLLISPQLMARLGPAVNSGRGLFLYGAPGNGKTSIAERITQAFGKTIWLPRAIGIDGEIMRLFDPVNHVEAPLQSGSGLLDQNRVDKRWVRIRRPTIIVGGELTMDNLEVTHNAATGISEAPMQLKSNCGTLVIDDFGRQKISTDQLLNRWIVPLEKRYDFLNLASGKKIQVPFDQLIIFSTNLEPRDLCDDAFLRRIPYKVEVVDPDEDSFRRLFEIMSPKLGIAYCPQAIEYLVENHYRRVGRPFRCCQPRDLLLQVRNYCRFHGVEPELKKEYLDFACENYFAVM